MSEQTTTMAMLLSYMGEPFCGFAKQRGLLTVQGELERALRVVFRREVPLVCAGRTDAGVHAREQVVSFELAEAERRAKTLESIRRSVDALTHDSIAIRRVADAPSGFSARFDAISREYRYRLAFGRYRPLLTSPYTWWVQRNGDLDVDAMREAAAHLLGEHDFRSFCVAASAEGKNTVRELASIDIRWDTQLGEPGLSVCVVGNAFLHSMVRTIVGTLVEVGCAHRPPEWVAEALEAKDRQAAGPTAPAKGLVFWHVEYPEELRDLYA